MSEEKIYWYVLRVMNGKEERVVEALKGKLDERSFRPFIPMKTQIMRRKGVISLFRKKCFPCYVFVESDIPEEEFARDVFPIAYRLKDTQKFLSYDVVDSDNDDEDETEQNKETFNSIALHENDRLALSKVLGDGHCIDVSKGYKDGDKIRIISGPLFGLEDKIVKVNRKDKEAVIEVEMLGSTMAMSVALEFVDKA